MAQGFKRLTPRGALGPSVSCQSSMAETTSLPSAARAARSWSASGPESARRPLRGAAWRRATAPPAGRARRSGLRVLSGPDADQLRAARAALEGRLVVSAIDHWQLTDGPRAPLGVSLLKPCATVGPQASAGACARMRMRMRGGRAAGRRGRPIPAGRRRGRHGPRAEPCGDGGGAGDCAGQGSGAALHPRPPPQAARLDWRGRGRRRGQRWRGQPTREARGRAVRQCASARRPWPAGGIHAWRCARRHHCVPGRRPAQNLIAECGCRACMRPDKPAVWGRRGRRQARTRVPLTARGQARSSRGRPGQQRRRRGPRDRRRGRAACAARAAAHAVCARPVCGQVPRDGGPGREARGVRGGRGAAQRRQPGAQGNR